MYDTVLEFTNSGDCGPVSLFGGDGADTFRARAVATIQDYETHESIELLQAVGSVLTSVTGSVTTVFVDGNVAVFIDGVWDSSQLNVVFA